MQTYHKLILTLFLQGTKVQGRGWKVFILFPIYLPLSDSSYFWGGRCKWQFSLWNKFKQRILKTILIRIRSKITWNLKITLTKYNLFVRPETDISQLMASFVIPICLSTKPQLFISIPGPKTTKPCLKKKQYHLQHSMPYLWRTKGFQI